MIVAISSRGFKTLSPREDLRLLISTNQTLKNFLSDQVLTKDTSHFSETSRNFLFIQGPMKHSPSASETVKPSSNCGI